MKVSDIFSSKNCFFPKFKLDPALFDALTYLKENQVVELKSNGKDFTIFFSKDGLNTKQKLDSFFDARIDYYKNSLLEDSNNSNQEMSENADLEKFGLFRVHLGSVVNESELYNFLTLFNKSNRANVISVNSLNQSYLILKVVFFKNYVKNKSNGEIPIIFNIEQKDDSDSFISKINKDLNFSDYPAFLFSFDKQNYNQENTSNENKIDESNQDLLSLDVVPKNNFTIYTKKYRLSIRVKYSSDNNSGVVYYLDKCIKNTSDLNPDFLNLSSSKAVVYSHLSQDNVDTFTNNTNSVDQKINIDFIDRWNKYLDIENIDIFEKAIKLDYYKIEHAEQRQEVASGIYKVSIISKQNLHHLFSIGDEVELSANPPSYINKFKGKVISGDIIEDFLNTSRKDRISGEIARIIGISVRPIKEQSWYSFTLERISGNLNSKNKYLYLSLRGIEEQIRRRVKVRDFILKQQTPMKGLAYILDANSQYIPSFSSKSKYKLSGAVKKVVFGDVNITNNQRDAINIALNTPDIALIKGPPGTGKTTVIHAILQAINENLSENEKRGEVLLTSFQHDAVFNALERIRINGLPTKKYGQQKKGFNDNSKLFENFYNKLLKSAKEKSKTTQILTIVYNAHLDYINYPTNENALHFFKIVDGYKGYIGDISLVKQITFQINELQKSLGLERESKKSKQRLLSLIWGLRTDVSSYSHDGYRNALHVVLFLWRYLSLDECLFLCEPFISPSDSFRLSPYYNDLYKDFRQYLMKILEINEKQISNIIYDNKKNIIEDLDKKNDTQLVAQQENPLSFEDNVVNGNNDVHSNVDSFFKSLIMNKDKDEVSLWDYIALDDKLNDSSSNKKTNSSDNLFSSIDLSFDLNLQELLQDHDKPTSSLELDKFRENDVKKKGFKSLNSEQQKLVIDLLSHKNFKSSKLGEEQFFSKLNALRKKLIEFVNKKETRVVLKNSEIEQLMSKCSNQILHSKEFTDKDRILFNYYYEISCNRFATIDALSKMDLVFASTVQQSLGKDICIEKKFLQRGAENYGEDFLPQYDTVIVDEAARANPMDLLIPMVQAKNRIILVGDYKQLPHIVDEDIIKKCLIEREDTIENKSLQYQSIPIFNNKNEMQANYSDLANDFYHKSLFEYLEERLKQLSKKDGIERVIMLEHQFRMHPKLGQFVSDNFYDSELKSELNTDRFQHNLKGLNHEPAIWVNVDRSLGEEEKAKYSRYRICECNEIVNMLKYWLKDPETSQLSFGVISFYKEQVNQICEALNQCGIIYTDTGDTYVVAKEYNPAQINNRLKVNTVDAFQGMEFDIVILSMVRSNDKIESYLKQINDNSSVFDYGLRCFGHLTSNSRLCVSMSRQKRCLVVVGDTNMLDNEIADKSVHALNEYKKISYMINSQDAPWNQ